jgi:hypothetical protein
VLQVALLYTTALGVRRIRVHTLSLRTATDMPEVFRNADMEALATVLPRMAAKVCAGVFWGFFVLFIFLKNLHFFSCF